MNAGMLAHMGITMPFATISTRNKSLSRCAIAISINNMTVMFVAGFMPVTSDLQYKMGLTTLVPRLPISGVVLSFTCRLTWLTTFK